jgi:hypothetical protein
VLTQSSIHTADRLLQHSYQQLSICIANRTMQMLNKLLYGCMPQLLNKLEN